MSASAYDDDDPRRYLSRRQIAQCRRATAADILGDVERLQSDFAAILPGEGTWDSGDFMVRLRDALGVVHRRLCILEGAARLLADDDWTPDVTPQPRPPAHDPRVQDVLARCRAAMRGDEG